MSSFDFDAFEEERSQHLRIVRAIMESPDRDLFEGALKSERRPRRDRHGRRLEKPYGQAEEPEDPIRDIRGYRTNKPTDAAMRRKIGNC